MSQLQVDGNDFFEDDEPLEDVVDAFERSDDEIVTDRATVAIPTTSWAFSEKSFHGNSPHPERVRA